ncbi:helix-turn-helix domain-containing protein [Cytobacillus praedii]|nr:helix-turn-helix transcriptional regulator [Cytobacillus praedii]
MQPSGEFFKRSRKLSGLSQEEMAEKMFMPRSTISKIENDKMELKVSDAARWCQATNVPEFLAALLCGVDVNTVIHTLTTLMGGFITYINF